MDKKTSNPNHVHAQVLSFHPRNLLLVPAMLVFLLLSGQPARADSHTVFTFGGSGSERVEDTAVDTEGNIYVLGSFQSTVDFDPGPDTVEKTSDRLSDLFVASYTSDGTLRFVITIENDDLIEGSTILLDSADNFYIVGRFEGTVDFDPGPDTHLLIGHENGLSDAFVARYSPTGSLIYALSYGVPQGDSASDVVVDAAGNVYVTGTVLSVTNETVDFDPGPGEAIHTPQGYDSYVVSYDENGEFRYVFTFGGAAPFHDAHANSLWLDQDDTLYVGGYFEGTVDFDPGAGVEERTAQGKSDVFVAAYNVANGQLESIFTFGGEDDVLLYDIELSGPGILSVEGRYEGTVDFDPGPGTETRTSEGSSYLASYTTDGTLRFVNSLDVVTLYMAVDGAGNHFITGRFNDTVDFDPGPDTVERTAVGDKTYVAIYGPNGAFCSVVMFEGGPNSGYRIAFEPTGNAYVSGTFQRTVDFDLGEGVDERTSAGFNDIYVALLSLEICDPLPGPEVEIIYIPILSR